MAMSKHALFCGLAMAAAMMIPAAAKAVPIGGVEFPQGTASFADQVVSYGVGGGGVSVFHRDPSAAIGAPDFTSSDLCNPADPVCSYVSLGDGGSIVLQFTDNLLTGSGDNGLDLWVFEIGPDVEDTFVAISKDGVTFVDIGKVFGSTAGIDIDAFGFDADDEFAFVRLIDDTNEGDQSGATAGADIDAVGAISTVIVEQPPTGVPEPASMSLIAGALALGGMMRLRRRKR